MLHVFKLAVYFPALTITAKTAFTTAAATSGAAAIAADADAHGTATAPAAKQQRRSADQSWCSEAPCLPQQTQPPCVPSAAPSPSPPLPRCRNRRCPDDFINSGITGTFPNGSDPCKSTHICVRDVLPGCDCYRGDSDSAWGIWCEDAISAFDSGGVVNGSRMPAHSAPQNIGADGGHPIYYFAAREPSAYVLYLPPANALPISAASGRYEYFLFQYLRRARNIGVFVLQTPSPAVDLWDHVPAHSPGSPYSYNCSQIKSGYFFCDEPCDMCVKPRSTRLIEAAIDKAAALGYERQILMGWSSGGAMASAFLDYAHHSHFRTAGPGNTSYEITGLALLSSGGQFCYAYDTVAQLNGSRLWSACGPSGSSAGSSVGGCCPQNLTEDHYWRHPSEYPHHPPTLLVQPVADNNADVDAARFYHQAMRRHGGTSTYVATGGSSHSVSPATFGVIASWIAQLLGASGGREK